jgi:triosephosphate isomerase
MQMPYHAALTFCQEYAKELSILGSHTTIIVCPSFSFLDKATQIFKNTAISIGAQDCSAQSHGAYTGQESAESLAQVGCSYCIVGHSEQRIGSSESNQTTADKAARLLEQGITPIVCIGETRQEYEEGATLKILEQQLTPIFEMLKEFKKENESAFCVFLAYEPVWAIGTNTIPTADYLEKIFSWISTTGTSHTPHITYKLLYGGSVNSANVQKISAAKGIDGFLIGSASLDFQNFKKIVSLL